MPSVLIELGYISTHDEEAFLNSQNGIRKMSQSIYNAFLSYKRQHTKGKTTGAEKDVLQAESDETQAVEGAVTDTPESDIGVLTQNSDKPSTSEPEEKSRNNRPRTPGLYSNTNPGFHPTDSCGQFPFQKPFSDRFL